MAYQYSFKMFSTSTRALEYSISALKAELTLSPFYDFEHFAAMTLSFLFHFYNILTNLILAICNLPMTLYSIFADDSCISAFGCGVASIFLHVLATIIYAVNLVITPMSVACRTMLSVCLSTDDTDEYREHVSDEISAAVMTLTGDKSQSEHDLSAKANQERDWDSLTNAELLNELKLGSF